MKTASASVFDFALPSQMRKALSGLSARSFDITKRLMNTLTIEPRIVPDYLENLGIGLMAYYSGASLILGQKISDTNY